MHNLGVTLPVFKLGTVYPLPEKKISQFINPLSTLIVVEELQPFLELRGMALAKDVNPTLKIIGKRSGHFSEMWEYNIPIVEKVLAAVLGKTPSLDYDKILEKANKLKIGIPYRNPIFCAGCPHRGTLWAFRQALTRLRMRDNIVYNNDIGCYSMAMLKPNEFTDTMLCMGASLGLSAGMQLVLEDKVVAMVGDSTLYHASLPGIVNLIHHNANVTLFVLDNSVTAMTGQQWNPNSPYDAGRRPARKINMEAFFHGLGADKITVINPFDTRDAIKPIMGALEALGFSVIISRGECALFGDREKKSRGERIIPSMNEKETCRKIYACIKEFHCPAILVDEADGKIDIMTDTCNGCLECQKVCPVNAPRHIERGANQEVAG
jgi:indolepyruvate ferredoxin oxidoreductase alpha subunit